MRTVQCVVSNRGQRMCDFFEIFGEILVEDAPAQLLEFVADCVSSVFDAVCSSKDRRNPPGGAS